MSEARDGAAIVPSLALAVLAKFTCTLCLTAYAGVLSALGVGFVANERGLAVLTIIFLALGLLSLGWSARRHHRSIPLMLGTIGAVLVLAGRRGTGGAVELVGRPAPDPDAPANQRRSWRQSPVRLEDPMAKRSVEVFTAGCALCDEAVEQVEQLACSSCDVTVHDLHTDAGLAKAKEYGVVRAPTVVVNGVIADCCRQGAVNVATLRSLGVGVQAEA